MTEEHKPPIPHAEVRQADSPSAASPGKNPNFEPGRRFEQRVSQLPHDVGWMLFGVGFAGFVAPGILGLPFMVAGGMILWPKTTSRLQSLLLRNGLGNHSVAAGMKQIERFIDDLERRYPRDRLR